MRKVIYGGACSLDGFLAGPDGAIDWLHFSKDVEAIMAQSWATTDTILFGRKTWEGAYSQGGATSMPGMTSYVFSSTLTKLPYGSGGARLVRQDAGAFVKELKRRPGKDMIVMSGGNLARSLLKAGGVLTNFRCGPSLAPGLRPSVHYFFKMVYGIELSFRKK